MFIEITDLGSSIYGYQINIITEGDDEIVLQAIEAAIDEVKSYLTATAKDNNQSNKLIYDVNAIFAAQDEDRNSLILRHTITLAKWYVVELCKADIIYEQARQRYDRAIKYLEKIRTGQLQLGSLPTISISNEDACPVRMGANRKFNHHY